MPETQGYEPSEEEVAKIGVERLEGNEYRESFNREALNKIREMGEQGFRNMTAELAEEIVRACKEVRLQLISPSSATGENPSGITAEEMQEEAREAIEKLADFHSDAEPFDDAVVNPYGGGNTGRFRAFSNRGGMKIRAFHKAKQEGEHDKIAEYKIPYSLWQGVERNSHIPANPQIDSEKLHLTALKQETELALHEYNIIKQRLESLSINPDGGETVFNK